MSSVLDKNSALSARRFCREGELCVVSVEHCYCLKSVLNITAPLFARLFVVQPGVFSVCEIMKRTAVGCVVFFHVAQLC